MGVEDDGHHAVDEEDENGEHVAIPTQPSSLRAPHNAYVLQTDADFRKRQSVDAEDLGQRRKVLLFDSLLRIQEEEVPTQAPTDGDKI